jgi:hypothetical protein
MAGGATVNHGGKEQPLDEALWGEHQYAVLVDYVHYDAYWRCSAKAYRNSGIGSEFWKRTVDGYLLLAVVHWCMAFGTDSSETHWKKVIGGDGERSVFRDRLLAKAGIDLRSWESIHKA